MFFYLLLGLLQGSLEWLPVSSQGQILLIGLFYSEFNTELLLRIAFFLHFGTMMVVLIKFRSDWMDVVDYKNDEFTKLREFLVLTTIGTAVTGIPIRILLFDLFESSNFAFMSMIILGLALIATGGFLYLNDKNIGENAFHNLSRRQMILVGMFQGFAIIPGVSRSAVTVSILLFLKIRPHSAFKGSFLISVPAVLGSIGLEILDAFVNDENLFLDINLVGMLFAIITAFVVGYFTIQILLSVARNYKFSKITISMGIIVLIVAMIGF